jgi:hypothetical protein
MNRRQLVIAWSALLVCGAPLHAQQSELFDPRVMQSTVGQTICRPGYVDHALPPFDTLMKQKDTLIEQRHIDPDSAAEYALDHRLPVLLGGSPSSAANLDLRRWDGRAGQSRKERLVVLLKRCVCIGEMPLAQAQDDILGDWAERFPNLSSLSCRGE